MGFLLKTATAPIYRQVADYLREEITSKRLKPGEKLPSEPELARRFNINHLTLRKGIKLLKEQKFIAQCPGKGTFVLDGKQEETSERAIGVYGVPENATDPYYSLLISGLRKKMGPVGIYPLFFNGQDDIRGMMEKHGQFNLKGAIVFSPPEEYSEAIACLAKAKVPYVIMGASFASFRQRRFACVDIDHRSGAKKAVEYLIGLGHRRIAYLGGKEPHCVFQQRFSGYLDAMKNYSINPDKTLIFRFRAAEPKMFMTAVEGVFHSNAGAATAVFAAGYAYVLNFWRAMEDRRYRIPDDISLVGCDSYGACEYLRPKLTVIAQPVQEMAEIAVDMLRGQMEGNQKAERQFKLLDANFMIGESCARASRCPEAEKNKDAEFAFRSGKLGVA